MKVKSGDCDVNYFRISTALQPCNAPVVDMWAHVFFRFPVELIRHGLAARGSLPGNDNMFPLNSVHTGSEAYPFS
jgi:hypothetical protein